MKYILVIVMMAGLPLGLEAQDAFKKKKRKPQPFRWVNPPVASTPKTVKHATFKSPSMGVSVGYYIYLPTHYSEAPERRFPVVYYLHGGRPGSELKSVRLANHIHPAMEWGKVSPVIYVFVNGGPVSHYNMPKQKEAQGEAVFIKELIPHIDATYRTIARREGRGLEGFSQGGRGTARIMFKHRICLCRLPRAEVVTPRRNASLKKKDAKASHWCLPRATTLGIWRGVMRRIRNRNSTFSFMLGTKGLTIKTTWNGCGIWRR